MIMNALHIALRKVHDAWPEHMDERAVQTAMANPKNSIAFMVNHDLTYLMALPVFENLQLYDRPSPLKTLAEMGAIDGQSRQQADVVSTCTPENTRWTYAIC
jgi:hypothetical protein